MEWCSDAVSIQSASGRNTARRKGKRMLDRDVAVAEVVLVFVVVFCMCVEQNLAADTRTDAIDHPTNTDLMSATEGSRTKRQTLALRDPRLWGQGRLEPRTVDSWQQLQQVQQQREEKNVLTDCSQDCEQILSTQKRLTDSMEPLVSRKEGSEGSAGLLSRKKRERGIADLPDRPLSRQKRVEYDVSTDSLHDLEQTLSRQKRLQNDGIENPGLTVSKKEVIGALFSRETRETGTAELSDVVLSRQTRANNLEPALMSGQRGSDVIESALSRQKRFNVQLERMDNGDLLERSEEAPSELQSKVTLSRQKRVDEEAENPGPASLVALLRQKRFEDDSEETLSRQKRFEDDSDVALSRQKRFEVDSDVALSRQKRFEDDSDVALSRQKRFEDDSDVALSRQKRFEDDSDVALSRQKRFDDDYDVALSRQKRFEDDSDEALSRQKRFEDDSDVALSRQKRFEDDSDVALSRQKRLSEILSEVKSLPGEEHSPSEDSQRSEQSVSRQRRENRDNSFATKAIQKRRLLAFSDELPSEGDFEGDLEAALMKQEVALEERRKREPEHKLYNEDLLLRRLRAAIVESRKGKNSQGVEEDVESDDSWEQELRIRQQLSERAVHYGIQRRKERLNNPDPMEMSFLQRIKQDAEEIMRRRAMEEEYALADRQHNDAFMTFTGAEDEEDGVETSQDKHKVQDWMVISEEGKTNSDREEYDDKKEDKGEEEEKSGGMRKKPEKAILKLLNLMPAKHDQEHAATHALKEKEQEENEKAEKEKEEKSSEAIITEVKPPATATTANKTSTLPSDQDIILRFDRLLANNEGKLSKKKTRRKLKKARRSLKKSHGKTMGADLLDVLGVPSLTV